MSAYAALLAGVACAAGSRAAARAPAPQSAAPSRATLLTEDDLQRDATRSLRDIVASRWPAMLWGRPPRGDDVLPATRAAAAVPERFGVYDAWGSYIGGPEFLDLVQPSAVRQLRRLTAVEEYGLFGRQHPAGAFVVTWKTLTGPRLAPTVVRTAPNGLARR